jgi:DNA replication and repair protein RecF
VARVVLDLDGDGGGHRIEVGFQPGETKHLRVDDSPVESLASVEVRPLVSVFLPERLELVKGAPAARRAHLDQFVAALWPARAETRTAYSRALAQRNALVARIRGGTAGAAALDAWDAELARHGVRLMADRDEAVRGLGPLFVELAGRLGLPGEAELRYRPRSDAGDAEGLAAELAERRAADLERGFTAHGPHRDELQLLLGGVGLRAYGSQGQQRAALLALLFAERGLLAERRARPPLMLLDDVMSELDAERRELLADLLRSGGQSVITTTEPDHVPGTAVAGGGLIHVEGGAVTAAPRAVAA